jgi:site-specific DNA-methyltransferase (adenine-specific)
MPRPRPRAQTTLFRDRNLLVYGNNLAVLRNPHYFPSESVDLVYLDPPFKPNERYNVLFRARGGTPAAAQVRAFEDTWHWDEAAAAAYHDTMENAPGAVARTLEALKSVLDQSDMFAYLCMMAPRLVELHRVLRDTGSIYLHCDPAASHYLKVLMDAVFGAEHFRNEIIWKRTTAHSSARKFAPIHDTLLCFAKGDRPTWNSPRTDYDPAYLDKYYRFDDGDGRLYWRADLCAEGTRKGSSGQPWRGFDPSTKGMHWKFKVETLDTLDAEGRIYWAKGGTGWPQYKRYRDELKGKAVPDMWDDIDRINPVGKERLHYPTQKPRALLDRIIQASSNPGDTVLDPFCGCGTTIASADSLDRQWIGIDVAYDAIRIIRDRLTDAGLDPKKDYEVWGEPESAEDAERLADEDKYQFQWWAVSRLGGREIERKKGADKGIDGRFFLRSDRTSGKFPEAIISVKAGATGPAHVRELRGALERENADVGVLVTLHKATAAMRAEAASAGDYASGERWYPRIQLLTAADIIAGKRIEYPVEEKEEEPSRARSSVPRRSPRPRRA